MSTHTICPSSTQPCCRVEPFSEQMKQAVIPCSGGVKNPKQVTRGAKQQVKCLTVSFYNLFRVYSFLFHSIYSYQANAWYLLRKIVSSYFVHLFIYLCKSFVSVYILEQELKKSISVKKKTTFFFFSQMNDFDFCSKVVFGEAFSHQDGACTD